MPARKKKESRVKGGFLGIIAGLAAKAFLGSGQRKRTSRQRVSGRVSAKLTS
jgi:hypothetical protein